MLNHTRHALRCAWDISQMSLENARAFAVDIANQLHIFSATGGVIEPMDITIPIMALGEEVLQ